MFSITCCYWQVMLLLEWQCILKATGVCLYLLWYNIWYKFNKKSMLFRKEDCCERKFYTSACPYSIQPA